MGDSPAKRQSSSIFDGAFELLCTLGYGAKSVVYKARALTRPDSYLPEIVALKVFTEVEKHPRETINRVKREALSLLASRHRNVVRLYDYVADTRAGYLVLEFAAGGNITSVMNLEANRLSPDRSVRLITQLLAGIEAIHRVGLVHCDIKPENLLLVEQDTLKISDFSVAVLPTEKHLLTDLAGTFDYLAPECLDGGSVSEATDLYSCAVTFYQLLTGHLPFDGSTIQERVVRKMQGDRVPLSAFVTYDTSALEGIFARALAPDPELRYRSAGDFRRKLEHLGQESLVRPRRNSMRSPLAVREEESLSMEAPELPRNVIPLTRGSRHRNYLAAALALSVMLIGAGALLSSRNIANATLAGAAFHTPFLKRVGLWEGARDALSFGKNSVLSQVRQLTNGTYSGKALSLLSDGDTVALITEGLNDENAFMLTLGVPGWIPQRIVLSPSSYSNEVRVSACGLKLSFYISREGDGSNAVLTGYFHEHLSGREGKWEITKKAL